MGKKNKQKQVSKSLNLEAKDPIPGVKITQLGINFGDNDFWSTFITLLKALGSNPSFWRKEWTKEEIAKLLSDNLFSFYQIRQCWLDSYPPSKESEESSRNYLEIKEYMLFFNEEVDSFIKEQCSNFNGHFFLLKDQTDPWKSENYEVLTY